MTRITCSCKICKANAETIGAEFPLSADVPEALAKAVGKETHGLVYDANNPNAIGAAVRGRTGITPA